jgi:hypothetical protein
VEKSFNKTVLVVKRNGKPRLKAKDTMPQMTLQTRKIRDKRLNEKNEN